MQFMCKYTSHSPRLCWYRFQYKFANYSPNFLSTGSSNTSFLVINQRYDYAFGLFSGGKDNVSPINFPMHGGRSTMLIIM